MSRGARSRQDVAGSFRLRSHVVLCLLLVAGVSLVVRSFTLQVQQKDFLNAQADSRHLRTETITASRGMITDRHGEPLAVSSPVDSIWAEPAKLLRAVDEIGALARQLGINEEALVRKLAANNEKQFVYLKRHMTPERAARVMALDLPGVNAQREYRRYYPAGEVAGQVIGLTDIDDTGIEGLESALNGWMAGERGAKRVLRDMHGRPIEDVESIRPARNGRTLRTSIDLRIQYFAYLALKNAVLESQAKTGTVVVMDVKTGEVLAMVNQPGHNPNDRSIYNPGGMRNRGAVDVFEPGSSIKPFVIASALESGDYQPRSTVDTAPGSVTVGKSTIKDRTNLGEISLSTVLSRSSNVGITKIALTLTPEQLWTTLTRFGFGQITGVTFPGEQSGRLPAFQEWAAITHATMSYGYALNVTALQLVQAYAALGNDGVMMPATLLAVDEPPVGQRVIDVTTARAVLHMLEEVVRPSATGSLAQVDGFQVAGKTGTALKSDEDGYDEDRNFAIFAGLAPASNPRLAIVVVVDEPGIERSDGGEIAAPVFAEVMAESLRLLAVAPDAAPILNASAVAQGQ
ncbi:MAG: penicillin-binding transpeptidase domain-containing protein [Pseudomonadota bacterium]